MNPSLSDRALVLSNKFVSLLHSCGYKISREALLSSLADTGSGLVHSMVVSCAERGVKIESFDNISTECLELALISKKAVMLVSDNQSPSYLILRVGDNGGSAWQIADVEGFGLTKGDYLSSHDLARLEIDSVVTIGESEESASSVYSMEENGQRSTFTNWLCGEFKMMRPLYRDIVIATALINVFALASPIFVMNVYDRVVPNQAFETLWVLSSGILIVIIFDLLIKTLRYRFVERASHHLDICLSSRLFARVINTQRSALPTSSGNLVAQLKDFDLIKQFLAAASMTTLVDLPFMILFLFVIFMLGGGVVLVPIIAGIVLFCYSLIMHLSMKRSVSAFTQSSSAKTSVLIETINALEMVQTFNAEGRQKKVWEREVVNAAQAGMDVKQKSGAVGIFSSTVVQLSVVGVVVVGVYQLESQQLSLGGLIACVLLSSRALAPMTQVANLLLHYYHAKNAKHALDELCELPADYDLKKNPILLNEEQLDIELSDVIVSYPGAGLALNKVSISIGRGEKVGVIGKIGSGKSTLMRLLLGLSENESGSVMINGIELKHLDKKQLRNRIGYVPQDISLFRGTLRENLSLNQMNVEERHLLDCIDMAGLSSFVQKHPLGLDMQIGEGGNNLSGGQKQCVAIARSILSNPDLLLFDELTSAMDNQTEQSIISGIKRLVKNKTLIVSTHRASLLELVDRIIVMDDGKVVADGDKAVVLNALKRGLIKTGDQSAEDGKE